MANSLRAKLSKLRYERNITEEEYNELIKKLNGYDKGITDALDEVIRSLKVQFLMQNNTTNKKKETIVLHRDFIEVLEQLKR